MGKFTDYKLPLKSLSEGVHEMNFTMGKFFFVDMENTDIHDANLQAELKVNYHNGLYDLDFHITGDVIVICDRCLDDMVFPIDTNYHIVVKYGTRYNDENDEFLEIPEADNFLNVAYMLYDTVVLALPIKHVHPSGKCNRQMSALLKKHRAESVEPEGNSEENMEMEFECIEMSDDATDTIARGKTDPRWEKLRDFEDGSDH